MTRLLYDEPLLFETGDRRNSSEPNCSTELLHALPRFAGTWPEDGLFHMVLGVYAAKTPGCRSTSKPTWLILENAPQPDGALDILPEYGGRTGMRKKLASGSPELIVETAVSSRSYDPGPNLALYQRAGVPEYAALFVEEERIEWRVLEQGSYRLMQPGSDGVLRSQIFPGLWLDSTAFWKQDGARLLSVLEEGLDSQEHARFVERLTARQRSHRRISSWRGDRRRSHRRPRRRFRPRPGPPSWWRIRPCWRAEQN